MADLDRQLLEALLASLRRCASCNRPGVHVDSRHALWCDEHEPPDAARLQPFLEPDAELLAVAIDHVGGLDVVTRLREIEAKRAAIEEAARNVVSAADDGAIDSAVFSPFEDDGGCDDGCECVVCDLRRAVAGEAAHG